GQLACWGDNTKGEASPPVGTYTAVSTGTEYACAVRTGGTPACWGDNSHSTALPVAPVIAISAGVYHSCAVLLGGTLSCFGDNTAGGATPPAGTFSGPAISAGELYTCGIKLN